MIVETAVEKPVRPFLPYRPSTIIRRNSAAGSAGDRFVPVSSPMESCPKIELRSLESAFDDGERAVRFARLGGVGTI